MIHLTRAHPQISRNYRPNTVYSKPLSYSHSYPLKTEKPFVVTKVDKHTMEKSLFGYLDLKIHELVREREFKQITITGNSDRERGISRYEKRDKMFNWQRPTAELVKDDLIIKCFPGRDYVKHYASLIGTYLAIHQRKWEHVRYTLPSEQTLWQALLSSNLHEVPRGDIAILGYGLKILMGEEKETWKGTGNFSWSQKKIAKHQVVFIGCRHSYWGDVAGRIVTLLANKGFQRVIYVGKLGALQVNLQPNATLATGNKSFSDGEIVHWKNCFDFAKVDHQVAFGNHFTLHSIINETKDWLEKTDGYAFVDPEIGHMAKAAVSASIDFSYLHIVSDNLRKTSTEDLSNERNGITVEKRLELLKKIRTLIETSLSWQE